MGQDADEVPAPRNEALSRLDELLGEWTLTMSNAWFLPDTEMHGQAVFEWLGDAFIVMRSELAGEPAWDFASSYNDPRNTYVMLYHDERGTSRVFDMLFEGGKWEMVRGDPDFHQRLVGVVTANRIDLSAEASEDGGHTWPKDLDLTLERHG